MSLTQPKPTRAEVPWTPDFEYVCSGGHHLGAEHALVRCPVFIEGQPCAGELERIGKGSRS